LTGVLTIGSIRHMGHTDDTEIRRGVDRRAGKREGDWLDADGLEQPSGGSSDGRESGDARQGVSRRQHEAGRAE
jgi:hypothetical protein